MGKKEITSYNQKGGITAYKVNTSPDADDISLGRRQKSLPKWLVWLASIVSIIAGLIFIINSVKPRNNQGGLEMPIQKKINVTSHNQQGGITAYQVILEKGDRILSDSLIEQLRSTLSQWTISSINIVAVMGDQEAFRFASQIKNFLISEDYEVSGVDQAIFTAPLQGQHIANPTEEGVVKITIGSR